MKNERIVSISNWYLLKMSIIKIIDLMIVFGFFWLPTFMISNGNKFLAHSVGLFMVLIFGIGIYLNIFMYWKFSGIYINESGDHVVKIGGLISKEDKLINGVIRTNQINRGPFDQLLGMANISSGIFGSRRLSGVRNTDIKKYDKMMRDRSPHVIDSML